MKAVIFDMDGVLVDVSESYREVIKSVVKFFDGGEVSNSEIQKYKDMGGFNCDYTLSKELLKVRGKDVSEEEIISKFNEFYFGENNDGLIANEKWLITKEKLSELKKEFKLGIVTGRPRLDADVALKGYEDYFDVVITMDDTVEQKPLPEPLLAALNVLDVSEAVYIGDSVDDMQMGKKVGVKTVGVIPPYLGDELKEVLLASGASIVLEDINDIKEGLE